MKVYGAMGMIPSYLRFDFIGEQVKHDNELERNLRLEKVVDSEQLRLGDRRRKKSKTGGCCYYQTAQVGHGDGRRKKIKTGEYGSYCTAHVSPD